MAFDEDVDYDDEQVDNYLPQFPSNQHKERGLPLLWVAPYEAPGRHTQVTVAKHISTQETEQQEDWEAPVEDVEKREPLLNHVWLVLDQGDVQVDSQRHCPEEGTERRRAGHEALYLADVGEERTGTVSGLIKGQRVV